MDLIDANNVQTVQTVQTVLELILELKPLAETYLIGIVTAWGALSFVQGIRQQEPTKSEFYQSLLWPITLCSLCGLVAGGLYSVWQSR